MSSRIKEARQVARVVLQRVRRDEAFANLTLGAELERARLGAAERGLATELVYGVLRHRRRLDIVIERYLKGPPSKVDPEVMDILRIAAYQLLLLDRIPAHAAVNTAVAMARQLRGSRVGGFVNAVLRKIASFGGSVALEQELSGRAWPDRWSVAPWLAERLERELGLETAEAVAKSWLDPAPLVIRVNRLRTTPAALIEEITEAGGHAAPCRFAPDALVVRGLSSPFTTGSYLRGLWTAQDEAAQLVGLLAAPRPNDRVLDACAGIGGKSTHLAELMGQPAVEGAGAASLLSADVSPRKLQLLREHSLRLGVRCSTLQCDLGQSASIPLLAEQPFDLILLDAPCSGLGVLRRHPELKWRSEPAIAELVQLQRRLIDACLGWLKPGGVFVYSVCTVTEAEGPEQLARALERHGDLALEPPAPLSAAISALAPGGVLRTWPHEHGTDGFFAARLRKRPS